MTPRIHTIRQAILPLLVLVGAACAPSEGSVDDVGARGPAAEAAVYSVFPEVQPRWIEWPYRFEARRGSTGKPVFATPLSDLPKAIFVEVPIEPREPVVVHGKEGFAMRVWDNARRGAAELTASGLTYGRTGGGTSFWTARESGAEEWLYLPEGASQLEVARYRIEGGRPQQHEWAIDIYDENDKPRVTMTAPQVFATGGQRVDAKMVLEGDEAAVVLTKWVDGPLLVDPVFVQAGDMSGDRKWHEAVLLPSGRVMVLGGYHQVGLNVTDLATMELFDPATNTWSNGPAAAAPRIYPTATVTEDGRVLVVSQDSNPPGPPGTEIYDELVNTWTTPSQPSNGRYYHAALKLLDGRVLVAGDGDPPATDAEIYDPIANTWTPTPSMNAIHVYDNLVLLANGDAMVVGGDLAELYSPPANTWNSLPTPIYFHDRMCSLVLPNGNVVATGGTPLGASTLWGKGTELFDVATGSWTMLAALAQARSDTPLTLLPGGILFVAGGSNYLGSLYASSEIYDATNDAWAPGPALVKARNGHSQTRLADGRVLVAGGYDLSSSLQSTELLAGGQLLGAGCASALDCASFLCIDGVCCSSVCSGSCSVCSIAAGGTQDGMCGPASGNPCDDGDLCTEADTCFSGLCKGSLKLCPSNPTECFAADACDPATGNCNSQPLPDGTPCTRGICVGGTCVEATVATGTGGSGGAGNGGFGGSGGEAGSNLGGGGTGGVGGSGNGGEATTSSASSGEAPATSGTADVSSGGGGRGSYNSSQQDGTCAVTAPGSPCRSRSDAFLLLGSIALAVGRIRRR